MKECKQYITSDHNGIKWENKKDSCKFPPNIWRLNSTLLNNKWVSDEGSREIFKLYLELYENENEIITIRNKKGGITIVPTDIKRIIRDTMNSTLIA